MHAFPEHDPIHLSAIELRQLRLRLQFPFKTSFGVQQVRDTILVILHDEDGLIGVGETPSLVAPVFDHQYVWADYDVLQRFLLPAVLEQPPIASVTDLHRAFSTVKAHHFAKCGLDAAYWHLVSQRTRQPLASIWDTEQASVGAGFSIGGSSVEDVLERATKAVEAGIMRLKIKIWPGFDQVVVAAVREAYPNIMLQVDANCSYEPFNPDHAQALKSLDDYNLLLIEQPFALNRMFDHARFQQQTDLKTPLCLDESILNVHDARQAVELWDMLGIRERLILNIKPPRVGGFAESLKIAAFAQENDVTCWVGGMLETAMGKWMNIILAAHPACTLPGDHVQPQPYYECDIATPIPLADASGHIKVPTGMQPFELDWHAIDDLTIAQHRLDAHNR